MTNLSITVKFLAVLCLMAVTVVGVGFYAVTELTKTVVGYVDLLAHESKGTLAMARMNRGMSEIDRLLYRLIAETNDVQMQQVKADLDAAKTFFFAQALIATEVLPNQKSRIDSIVARFTELAPTMQSVEALALANRNTEATEALRPANAVIRDLRSTLYELTDEISKATDDKSGALAANATTTNHRTLGIAVAISLLALFIAWQLASRGVSKPILAITAAMRRLADGDTAIEIPSLGRSDEIGTMARALEVFRGTTQNLADRSWVKSNVSDITQRCLTAASARDLAGEVIRTLTPLLDGGHGVFYLADEGKRRLELAASYAFTHHTPGDFIAFGDGLIGQCALERALIIWTDAPSDYVRIGSALGEAHPSIIMAAPILKGSILFGVIEIASFRSLSDVRRALLEELLPIIALHLDIHKRRPQVQEGVR